MSNHIRKEKKIRDRLIIGTVDSSTIGESITASLDHVCLSNHITALTSLSCTTAKSLFADTVEMNEKCCKMNPTSHKIALTSLIKQHFFPQL